MCGVTKRPAYWLAYEPLPEVSHVQLHTALDRVLVAEPTTLVEGVGLFHSLPSWSVIVLDTLDSADLPGRLTANRRGFADAWSCLTEQATVLLRKKITVVLLTQLRYLGAGVGSSAWYIRSYLTAAFAMRRVKTESEFGTRTWVHTELRGRLDRRPRQKYYDVIYWHPDLGYAPELEVLQMLRAQHGAAWRSTLGVKVPASRVGAVLHLRYDPDLLNYLWGTLCHKKK